MRQGQTLDWPVLPLEPAENTGTKDTELVAPVAVADIQAASGIQVQVADTEAAGQAQPAQ
jgi:hypothetical protein